MDPFVQAHDAPEADVDAQPIVEVEAEPDLEICKQTIIKGGALKTIWMPEVEHVDGTEFLKLSKRRRDLTRFVSGRSLYLHKHRGKPTHTINTKWFEQMMQLRKEACDKRLKEVISNAAMDAGEAPPDKVRCASADDAWLCGRVVTVQLPPLAGEAQGRSAKVLWGVKGQELYMELSKGNLEYVRQAIRESSPVGRKKAAKVEARNEQPKRHAGRPRKPKAAAHAARDVD